MLTLITEAETPGKHQLRVILEKSRFEEETFQLYRKYQVAIHKDDPEKLDAKKYSDFLVNSPLVVKKASEIKEERDKRNTQPTFCFLKKARRTRWQRW